MKKARLSVVILSYNTKELLRNCLLSLKRLQNEVSLKVIVVDNASRDGSCLMVSKEFPFVKLVRNKKNLGFAKGNNRSRKYVKSKYVLFLNSDTILSRGCLRETLGYLERHKDVGALTCKILLPSGDLDKDTRRSFVTPWVGFTHLILRLDRVFPKSKFFSRYWYGYIPEDKVHEVDVIQGAFFLTRKKILDDLGWFDEDYFLDGEDIDLCWRIKERGWKIIYYPKVSILHFKGASKGKVASPRNREVSLREKLKFRMSGVDSMEIFYKKRLWDKYPILVNYLVLLGIKTLKLGRLIKTLLFG